MVRGKLILVYRGTVVEGLSPGELEEIRNSLIGLIVLSGRGCRDSCFCFCCCWYMVGDVPLFVGDTG